MVAKQICTASLGLRFYDLSTKHASGLSNNAFPPRAIPVNSFKETAKPRSSDLCVCYLDLGVLWYIEIPVVSIYGRRTSAFASLDCSIASYWVSNVASMAMDVNGAGCYSSHRISLTFASMDLTTFVLIRASAFSGRPCSFHPWQCQPHNAFFHSLSIYLLNHQQKFEIQKSVCGGRLRNIRIYSRCQ